MGMFDRAAPWVAVLLSLLSYGWRLVQNPARPTEGFLGWWGWVDQGMYIRAARAWSAGVLDGAQHWYFPGYPMLAAPFVRLLPADPFTPVDILCLISATLLFCALAQRLTARPGGAMLGAIAWVSTVAVPSLSMRVWVEPWTTTPTAVLTLLSLWLLTRIIDRPSPRDAALLGLAASCVLLFRPTDAAVLLAVAGAGAGAAVLARRDWRSALAGAAGTFAGIALFCAIYLPLYGWVRSPYLAGSADVGFEWRLLGLRWVTLIVDPAPLVPNEAGLAQAVWWVIPGVMGAAACLAAARGTAWYRHAAVLAVMVAHVAVYLSYRDLHPQGLIRFGNIHYFKWVLPLLGLYAGLLLAVPVWAHARRLGWAAAGLAFLLFCWRAEFVPDGRAAVVTGPHTLSLPGGFGPIDQAVRVAAQGGFGDIYLGDYTMEIGGVRWPSGPNIKAQPVPGGFLLVALRPLPPGPAAIQFPDGVVLDATTPPTTGQQRIIFAAPAQWGWPRRAAERFHKWRASQQ